MTKQMDVYKCGKEMVIEVIKGACCCSDKCHDLSCCGEPMELQKLIPSMPLKKTCPST